MGYRSDVAIAIHKDLQGEFLTFLKTTRVMAEIFQGFTLDKDFKGDGHWLFTEKQIKWYDCDPEHYPEIDAFEKFFAVMDEDEETESKYRFVRIGERYDDVEERGEWYDSDIYVKREIQIGW